MEFKLQGGARLKVTESSFEDAIALNDAVMNAIGDIELDQDILATDFDQQNLLQSLTKASGFLKFILSKIKALASNGIVRECIFKCGERAVYENCRVTKTLFDDPKIGPQARKDFYAICAKIVEVNCHPFLESLLSLLKIGKQTNINTRA